MGSTSLQWENGQWQPIVGLPLTDRGYRHGMSAFETLAIRGGRLVFLAEHLTKLRHTCAALGFREPPPEAAFSSLDISHSSLAILRLSITAGDGPFRAPLDQGRILLQLDDSAPTAPPQTLAISSTAHPALFPGLKTGNYWPNIAAYRHAPAVQADETVLIDSANHVLSASLANLFARIDGLLLTPRTSSGARAGVLRDWVIQREDVIISDFHPEQLREASEIFLTNSGYGIAPITHLENKPLASQQIGTRLRNDYLAFLKTHF